MRDRTTIGFTVSLFIAGLAFEGAGSDYVVQTQFGILCGSLAAALLGYALLRASLPQVLPPR